METKLWLRSRSPVGWTRARVYVLRTSTSSTSSSSYRRTSPTISHPLATPIPTNQPTPAPTPPPKHLVENFPKASTKKRHFFRCQHERNVTEVYPNSSYFSSSLVSTPTTPHTPSTPPPKPNPPPTDTCEIDRSLSNFPYACSFLLLLLILLLLLFFFLFFFLLTIYDLSHQFFHPSLFFFLFLSFFFFLFRLSRLAPDLLPSLYVSGFFFCFVFYFFFLFTFNFYFFFLFFKRPLHNLSHAMEDLTLSMGLRRR